jgi:CheY-like chemotaxis protein
MEKPKLNQDATPVMIIEYGPPSPRVQAAAGKERPARPRHVEAEVKQQRRAAPGGVTVMFVEDDPSVAQMYKFSLEAAGYSVLIASDGLTALEMARRLLPDIMFLDIRIPKMDGLTVLETLRSDALTKRIPAVVLSNWNEKELVERSMNLGSLDHLTKSQTTPGYLVRHLPDWLKQG